MPGLPDSPGIYLWVLDLHPVYVGKTSRSLRTRLGSAGYSNISIYKTLAASGARKNGGQQTNCRVNGLANQALRDGHRLDIWYQVSPPEDAAAAESNWMRINGVPVWNKRDER